MVRAHDENLQRLGLVAERLGDLKDEVVFPLVVSDERLRQPDRA